jgi:hypothetical protein
LNRIAYCDEAASEFGFNQERGIMGLITQGQYHEREEVYCLLIEALGELVEQDD